MAISVLLLNFCQQNLHHHDPQKIPFRLSYQIFKSVEVQKPKFIQQTSFFAFLLLRESMMSNTRDVKFKEWFTETKFTYRTMKIACCANKMRLEWNSMVAKSLKSTFIRDSRVHLQLGGQRWSNGPFPIRAATPLQETERSEPHFSVLKTKITFLRMWV